MEKYELDILTEGVLSEAEKEGGSVSEAERFDLRKMVKLLEKHKPLMDKYMDLYAKYRDRLNYHYNETILSLIFLFTVLPDSKLLGDYKKIKTVQSDNTRVLGESDEAIDETTTASSAGSYATKFAFSKDGNPKAESGMEGSIRVEPEYTKEGKKIEEQAKTYSQANAERIGKENVKNTDKDRKSGEFSRFFDKDGSFKDYFYDEDTLTKEDRKSYYNETDVEDEIDLERGRGMESVEPDIPNEKWEERAKESMKSPNTDLDMYEKGKKRREEYKKARRDGYPKTPQPVKIVDESFDRELSKVDRLLNGYRNIDNRVRRHKAKGK